MTPLTFTGRRVDPPRQRARRWRGPAGLAPNSVDADFRNPRIQTWNLNVQRELFRNIGAHGRLLRLEGRPPARVAQPQPVLIDTACGPIPRLSRARARSCPGSALGNITEVTSLGCSRYKGLWVTLNQRFSGGLQFNGSYTLSKSEDTNSLNSQGVVVQDSTNIAGRLRALGLRRHAPLRAERDLGAAVQGQPAQGGLADRDHHPGADRQPDQHPDRTSTSPATPTSGPTSSATSTVARRSRTSGSRPTVCDPRIAGSCTSSSVFALPGLGRRQPLRQPRPQRRCAGPASTTPTSRSSRRRGSAGRRSSCAPRRSTCSTTRTSDSPGASPPWAARASA